MPVIGLIKEGKIPTDNRVALTPAQCKWMLKNQPGIQLLVESSKDRCYSDEEYRQAGATITTNMESCDILLGIKEVPVTQLIPGKTYLFFSHTRKKQAHNKGLMHALMDKKITLIDYECLEYEDGQRIIGFGFFAGIVGAHNGMMAYGNRTGLFHLDRVYRHKDYRSLINTYFGLKLPPMKIAVTGSGRVAHGVLEVMNLLDVQEVEPEEYLTRNFDYPVYVQLKGANLYRHKQNNTYNREDFHNNPDQYHAIFKQYAAHTHVLMNGVYWSEGLPRLFEWEDIQDPSFAIETIADITDDKEGSIPCNLGDATIEDPVYGVDPVQRIHTEAYKQGSIDMMAVGNLPNELPRDASRYFGEQLIKHVLPDLLGNGSDTLDKATLLRNGDLTGHFSYLVDYAAH